MSHDASSPKKLIYMANQIGKFFIAQKDQGKAVAGIATHLTKFWPPAMREKIIRHLDQGGEGLDPLTRQAVEKIKATMAQKSELAR
ncbi:MAG: formate dehydrogenase subunit delta [Alphaproteobacteria bacterium]|nr:formate dehydrogenase subunit delta [Alphaproteobacteria bacterium]MCL2452707.1 formate dehydrogenase subunit delta [Alphaproteobacteria bacterium]